MKKGYRFNIIDVVVIVAVVAVLGFVGLKFGGIIGGENSAAKQSKMKDYKFSFTLPEVPNYVVEHIKMGMKVVDNSTSDSFGKIISIEVSESEVYNTTSDGQIVKATMPDHSKVDIVAKGKAEKTATGAKVNLSTYGVGHSITIRTGNAKLFGKISDIELID